MINYRIWDTSQNAYFGSSVVALQNGTVVTAYHGEFDEDISDIAIVELFTGVEDIDGTPIYEGDIVKSRYKYAQHEISQIIVEDGNSYILGENLATGNEMLVSDHFNEIEVIGNIHVNPGLLNR